MRNIHWFVPAVVEMIVVNNGVTIGAPDVVCAGQIIVPGAARVTTAEAEVSMILAAHCRSPFLPALGLFLGHGL